MYQTTWIGAACWLLLACGGADLPDRPAYSRAEEVLGAAPRASGAQAKPSECTSSGNCQRECERGVASACTRWGDHVYASTAQRAEELWADACKAGDAAGCARLMQATAANAEVADRYAWRACLHGDAITCQFLGNAIFVRAQAPTPDEDAEELYRESARSYRLACERDRWLGCLRAAASLQRADDEGTKAEVQRLARRGFELVDTECKDSSSEACGFLAQWAENAGDAAKAKVSYARGCRALLARSLPRHRPLMIEEPLCKRARELGVAPPGVQDADPAMTVPWPQIVPVKRLETTRVAGNPNIQPPPAVAKYIAKHNITVMASAKLCLSELGLVSDLNFDLASGSTAYDRKLFEGMRTWRYRPFVVGGQPVPVCTRVMFIYRPR